METLPTTINPQLTQPVIQELASLGLPDDVILLAKHLSVPKAYRQKRERLLGLLGWTDSKYEYWAYNAKVIKAKRLLTKLWFQNDIPDVLMAMRNEALRGNTEAAKLVLKYVDEWQEGEQKDAVVHKHYSKVQIINLVNNLKAKKI